MRNQGYRAARAGNGRDAMEQMAHLKPDLVTPDLMMPDMNGFQVIDQLKRDGMARTIPVFVLTAKSLSKGERGNGCSMCG